VLIAWLLAEIFCELNHNSKQQLAQHVTETQPLSSMVDERTILDCSFHYMFNITQ
jgi:hypothetical protein